MKSLVLTNPKGGVVMFREIGEEIEIADPEFAYKILSECGDMVEHVEAEAPKEKVAKSPKNKSASAPVTK
jgi:hypothetical protein